ncbi:hypothetical protein COC69_01135 [Bacillus cereus]|uniref:Uncharacterized protein n=1 Tax=Bacillus cereus TaxID=1396 RepID=A0A9X7GY40_BACCE|nr:hypothetical protein [Bacillus cereus]PGS83948.1 hypothetical protein COC69_01135 [Bacillus cereus]
MVKKKRLVDFGDVASTNTENKTTVSTDIGTKNNTNTTFSTDVNNDDNVNTHTDIGNNISVSQLLEKITSKNNKIKKIQRSIYLNEDISKKFDRYGKKFGKGAKSDLIENFLREALKDF